MAQQETKSTSANKRPSSIKLQTSLSHPVTSKSEKLSESNSHRCSTLPEPLNKTYPLQSDAERYIAYRTQASFPPNEQQNLSPTTPLSAASTTSTTGSTNPFLPLMTHAERMNKWQQERKQKIYKKQKHQYVYGPPPSASTMNFIPFIQSNTPLSSERNSLQQTHTIKKKLI